MKGSKVGKGVKEFRETCVPPVSLFFTHLLALLPSFRSISPGPGQIEDDLFIVVRQGSVFVSHAGELFDGALPDFFVLGAQQPVPHLEEINLAVNFFDKLRGIIRERILSWWQFFAWSKRFAACVAI